MYILFYGPLYMDVPGLTDLQELIYISSVRTQGVVWKTYQERWIIGTDEERGSGKFVLSVRLDDDDDIFSSRSCDRNTSHILNSHLDGACEIRQVAMVAPSSLCLTIFVQSNNLKVKSYLRDKYRVSFTTYCLKVRTFSKV